MTGARVDRIQELAALSALVVERWLDDRSHYRHHGIGVFQGYVLESVPPEPEYRLHVWHPELRLADMTDSGLIHDHRFDLESTVLAGLVVHTVYPLEEAQAGTYQVWSVQNARAAAENNRVGWVTLEGPTRYNSPVPHTQKIGPGQSYRFPKRRFHRTDVDRLTITLCRKERQETTAARILSRYGREPRHGFDHEQVETPRHREILAAARARLQAIARGLG
jgi:hypothetical protein